jgi:hypothetical protein
MQRWTKVESGSSDKPHENIFRCGSSYSSGLVRTDADGGGQLVLNELVIWNKKAIERKVLSSACSMFFANRCTDRPLGGSGVIFFCITVIGSPFVSRQSNLCHDRITLRRRLRHPHITIPGMEFVALLDREEPFELPYGREHVP